jgi:hypothetical protein
MCDQQTGNSLVRFATLGLAAGPFPEDAPPPIVINNPAPAAPAPRQQAAPAPAPPPVRESASSSSSSGPAPTISTDKKRKQQLLRRGKSALRTDLGSVGGGAGSGGNGLNIPS